MKVKMKDIADYLGLSINAVSIALNDKPGISDETRLLILTTADQMGYINQKKQYLSAFSKSNICVMMQSYYANTGHFYSIVLKSIVETAKKKSYFALLNYFEDQDFSVPECIIDRKVSGVLVVGKISDRNLNLLNQQGIPVVLVDYTSLYEAYDCVLTHNKQGGYMMTSYIIQKGYKTIGFFGDLGYSFSFEDRFIGYKQALLKSGLVNKKEIDNYINRYCYLEDTEQYVLAHDILAISHILQSKPLPEVIFCANDSNAFALMNALNHLGYKIPEDVAIAGFDDTPLCEKAFPKITSVQVQKELMGEFAVEKLIVKIQRKHHIPTTSLLSVKIAERDSL